MEDKAGIAPTSTGSGNAEILLRRENATTNQKALKEKFVVVYEALFNGVDPSAGNPNFWDEVLLLKVNSKFLDRCIILTAEDVLVSLKGNISMIFTQCTRALTDSLQVRQKHALETLSVLMRSIFRKRFNDFGGEVTNILCGSMDKADVAFTNLLVSIQKIIESEALGDGGGRTRSASLDGSDSGGAPVVTPVATGTATTATAAGSGLLSDVIQLLLVIVTAVDNINQNTLFEYFLKVDLFPTFAKVIEEGRVSLEDSFNLLVLTVILANYQKNEATNIYHQHLKQIDRPAVLKAFSNILSEVWTQINKYANLYFNDLTLHREYSASPALETNNGGMWYRFGSYVSSFIYKSPSESSSTSGMYAGSCLLVLYELIYLNANFAKSLVPPRVLASPRVSPRSPRLPTTPSSIASTTDPSTASKSTAGVPLMQHFLTFCSYVFADCSEARAHAYAKLCLLILTCISENNYLEEFFHDPSSAGTFTYSKSTGPADKSVLASVQPQAGQGLACVVLDTINLFMKQNMKKKVDLDMYRKCVGVVHRILSYEKRTATRLAYKWKDVWNSLFLVMKQSIGAPADGGIVGTSAPASGSTASTAPPQTLTKQQLGICMQVVTVLNLFITFGDSFLPSPSDYDDLYYEIMRVSKSLELFYSIAEKVEHSSDYSTSPDPSRPNDSTDSNKSNGLEGGGSLATLSMLNIKTIITHFSGKIQQWNFAHPEVTLTPDMVLKIIKDNYDSLKLKFQENLDFYEAYVETTETPYFRQLTRTVVQDLKATFK